MRMYADEFARIAAALKAEFGIKCVVNSNEQTITLFFTKDGLQRCVQLHPEYKTF